MRIGALIYTYNRVDDARINMEIIRDVWAKQGNLSKATIVHAFNGEPSWYSEKYLEDDLIRIKNTWHFEGASNLIDAGMDVFMKKYNHIDYVVVLASDTWLVNGIYLNGLVDKMKTESLHLATCSWGLPERNNLADVGMAVDFFIVDLKWAKKYKNVSD